MPGRSESARWPADPAEAWRSEVALEMWVDTCEDPVVVYLAGTLTDETAANVTSVLHGLVEEGRTDLVLDAGRLVLEGDWFDVLCDIQDETRQAGGSVTWSFTPNSDWGPFLVISQKGQRHRGLNPAVRRA
jgi:hypothetical protein